jgi:K+-sensing histidine kinase KdpD
MASIESKLQYDSSPDTDAESLLSPAVTSVARYAAAIAMTVIATIVAVSVDSKVAIPNLSLVFVVPVIVAGVSLGLGPSLCSALLGALAYNFFLTEPRYSLVVDDVANIWAIGLLFVIGVIASGVAFTSHRRAAEAGLLRKQIDTLHGYGNDLVAADGVKAVLSITSRTLAALFQVPAVALLVDEGKVVLLEKTGDVEPQESDLEAARSSLATGAAIRSGVYPNLASRFDFWPVATGGHDAVIGLAFDPDERPSKPDALVGIVARLLAPMLRRQQDSIQRSAPAGR